MGCPRLRRITGRRRGGRPDSRRCRNRHSATVRRCGRARLPALLDRQGEAWTDQAVAAALTRSIRPRGIPYHFVFLAVVAVVGATRVTDRHPFFSQPTTAITAAADR